MINQNLENAFQSPGSPFRGPPPLFLLCFTTCFFSCATEMDGWLEMKAEAELEG